MILLAVFCVAADGAEGLRDAQDVLAKLHAAFPEGPLLLDAELRTSTRDGKVVATHNIELLYRRTNDNFAVALTVYDAFGGLIRKVELSGIGSSSPVYRSWLGQDLEPDDPPALTASICDTDFRWGDLTLAFLWWDGGQLTGTDSMKGRSCYIVDLPAPASSSDVAGVELWIDAEMFALLRAKFYDSERSTVKRFDIKSFAKTGEMWMVKDIDMRSYPSRQKTTLRVRSVDGITP